MPVTQRKRSFQLFRKLKFSHSGSSSAGNEGGNQLDIDKMILHAMDCLGALQCVMGQYDSSRARVFWGAVSTIAEIGIDTTTGHVDRRHPGALHLLRAFPNEQRAIDGRGWLPLHWAAVIDNAEVNDVRQIARADPLATVKGFTPPISANPGHLISAVRHPSMEVVKCLFDFYPRMASSKDNEGDLPLHYAARYSESIEMIRFLLQANPCSTKVKGESNLVPLQCALYNECEERLHIVKCLLDADPTAARMINGDGDTALHLAVDQECDKELLVHLIRAYPEAVMVQNDIGLLPLHVACYSKHAVRAKETVDLLLSINPDSAKVAGATGHLPCHYAAEFSTAAVLQSIARAYPEGIYRACAEDNDNTPLMKAVTSGNEDTVRFICAEYPEALSATDSHGLSPLHCAAEGESLSILKMLHQACPHLIRQVDCGGRVPLAVFCEVHQERVRENDREADCVRFLLKECPASVSVPSKSGETALSLCNGENNPHLRRLLLQAQPQLSPEELGNFNYVNRRMAMFLAFAAINADGIPCIFSRLRSTDVYMLKHVLSYL
jgi:ankyrin repeat protein